MTVMVPLSVLELACSRICHDLISPVGAINNGLELSQELDGEMAVEAMTLVSDSGRRAAARLQVFRLAFGAAGGQATVGPREIRTAMQDYLAGGKITLDWPVAASDGVPAWPAGGARLVVLAIMLAEEALTHGGRIVPRFDPAVARVTLIAAGRTAALSPGSLDALQGRSAAADQTPRSIIGYLARQFCQDTGLTLKTGPGPAMAEGEQALMVQIDMEES